MRSFEVNYLLCLGGCSSSSSPFGTVATEADAMDEADRLPPPPPPPPTAEAIPQAEVATEEEELVWRRGL